MSKQQAQAQITRAVLEWSGTAARPHRFGGTEYVIGSREIGHIHGNRMVDIPFPTRVRDAVVASGAAEPHHLLPHTGWISFYIREDADVNQAIALLRQSYEIAINQKKQRPSTAEEG